jgi:hypothetical protein
MLDKEDTEASTQILQLSEAPSNVADLTICPWFLFLVWIAARLSKVLEFGSRVGLYFLLKQFAMST